MAMQSRSSSPRQSTDISAGSKPGFSSQSGEQRRAIAVEWEGVAPLIAGEVTLQQANGELALSLPNGQGECTGSYFAIDKQQRSGAWSVSCSNGLSALGTYTAHVRGKGASGEGRDKLGREVKYSIAGAANR